MIKREHLEKGYELYSKIIYNLPNGYAPLPRLIIWFPSYRCNLRCKMCTFYGEYGVAPIKGEEMTLEEIKKMFGRIKSAYKFTPLPHIGIMGGEPFIRKDIFEILTILSLMGFKYSITTNLSLLNEEKIEQLLQNPPSDLRVSIDGVDDVHDEIRNQKGLYNKVIDLVGKIRNHPKGRILPIRFNCTISRRNVGSLAELVDVASELKVDLNYQHLQFLDEKREEMHKKAMNTIFNEDLPMWRDLSTLSEDEVDVLINQIKLIRKRAKEKNVYLTFVPELDFREIRPYYRDLHGYVHSTKCSFVWGAARMNVRGDVYPCLEFFFGNIRNQGFEKIWNGKKARFFRKVLRDYKLFPGCVRCCKL